MKKVMPFSLPSCWQTWYRASLGLHGHSLQLLGSRHLCTSVPRFSSTLRRVQLQNLPPSTTWQNIKDLGKKFGPIRKAYKFAGVNQACGVIIYKAEDDAAQAIQGLNGLEYKNRVIKAVQDSEIRDLTVVGRVFVGSLSMDTTWHDLNKYFLSIGRLNRVYLATDDNGKSKRFGIVEYEKYSDAKRAIAELNATTLNGSVINVKW